MSADFTNCGINMAAERPKGVVKKPRQFAAEFSRSMTVKKTEARKRGNKLYDVEVTEVDKVNKRIRIHFMGCSTQFDEWRYFGGDEGPDHKHLLSSAIFRTE